MAEVLNKHGLPKIIVPCKCGEVYFTAYDSENPDTGKHTEVFEIGAHALIETKVSISRTVSSATIYELKPGYYDGFLIANKAIFYELIREKLESTETNTDTVFLVYDWFVDTISNILKDKDLLLKNSKKKQRFLHV